MAKMRIHEISKSLQAQGMDIKSADLIQLLNKNGFEAKSANSNIEDAAIAFLLKAFSDNNHKSTAKVSKQEAKPATKVTEKSTKTPEDNNTKKIEESVVVPEKPEKKPEEIKPQPVKQENPVKVEKQEPVKVSKTPATQEKNETRQNNRSSNYSGGNYSSERNRDNRDNRESQGRDNNSNQGGQSNYNRDNQNGQNSYNRDNRNGQGGYNRDNRGGQGGYNRDNRGGQGGYNRDNRGGQGGYNRDNNGQGGYNRDNNGQGGYNRDNNGQGGYNRDNRGGQGGYNRDNRGGQGGYNRDNRGGQGGYNRDNNNSQGGYNRDNRGGQGGYNRDNRNGQGGGYNRDNNGQGGYNRDNRGGQGGYNRDNRGGQGGYNRDNRGGQGGYNRDNNGQGGFKVLEKFEKSQSGFDSIKQEQKPGRTQRSSKDNKKYGKDKDKDKKKFNDDVSRLSREALNKKKDPNRKGAFIKPEVVVKEEPEDSIRTIMLPEKMTLKDFGDKLKVPAAQIIKKLFLQGKMVSINTEISFDEAEEIALEYNCIAQMEEKVDVIAELLKEDEDDDSKLKKRPPVVCVMGHVDHGKTSLLDAIRKTDVISHEAGGITQHIGAYTVRSKGEKITFLDTPGHEAFTSMRMRGANSTDIAILVVAADDGVMPQTVEAINHAKAAGIEIIVAVNKIDKPGANIDRVKQELVEYELVAEDWGGSTVFVPVSAKTGEGIDTLLEMIILTAEVCELKADPNRNARGIVIEAQLDKGRGPVATILVQKGTLKVGDHIVIGASHGKVRAMMDDKGRRVKEAKPSTPVEILGLNEVPDAGEIFLTTDNEKEARTIVDAYVNQSKAKLIEDTRSVLSLDGLFDQIQAGNIKELNIIVKADVQGSVEAIKQSLLKLTNEEVAIRIIHGGVGAITESDVSLAIASSAIIIGFNVRPDNMAKATADREKVDLRLYKVIYDAIADIEAAMKGMLDPIYEEKVTGHAEVRQIFKASGLGTIAGSYLLDGKITRGSKARIYRGDNMVFEGNLASLKRFKDDVKEVAAGYECGLVFDGFNDIQIEDRVESYIMVEVPR